MVFSFNIFLVAFTLIQITAFLGIGYLFILTIAAFFAPRRKNDLAEEKYLRFAILVPAHNEEVLLPELLESLQHLDYPSSDYDVHVIADNCVDATSEIANRYGAKVHTRTNLVQIGKGYALDWGLKEIWASGQEYDAFVIIDADSVVSANFLRAMNCEFGSGAQVVQAFYSVKDPTLSNNVALRFAALAVLHFLRPQGRMTFGGSVGLKGNGMAFAKEILALYPWPASVTEDIEYHMVLLLNGFRVRFCPDAIVWGEMPAQFEQSRSQLDRWESGRMDMARKYVPRLLEAAFSSLRNGQYQQVYAYLDAVMEHLIPPFSLLFTGASLLFLVNLGMILLIPLSTLPHGLEIIIRINFGLGVFLIAGQGFYLLSGLYLANAPKAIYKQLLFAPIFIFRKIGQYISVLAGSKPQSWVKTTRNQS